MSDRKKHKTANDYLQYLKRDLSNQERHLFERDRESDPFEKEALEGMEMLSPDEAEEDILSLHSRLRKRLGKKRRIAWYSAAASIASLLIIGTIFLQIYNLNPEVAEKSINEEEFYPDRPAEPESTLSEDTQSEDSSTEETSTEETLTEETLTEETLPEEALREERVLNDKESENESQEPEYKTKGALQLTEGPPEEPEMITHVEADAATDVVEERSGRGARRRSDRVAKPAANQPASMEKKAYAKEENAQLVSRQVSGIVISGEDRKPLPGASVVVKGGNSGVVTNMDGTFSLPVQDDSNRTIVASYVGMETQEVQVEDDMNIELVMQPDAMALNEIVLVDQGIQTTGVRSAQPSGGFKSFKQYVEENIQMPDTEISSDREIVVLRFKVSPSGEITDINSLRSPGELFTQEARRLIMEGPSWIPATDDTGKIEEIVRLRIVFKN